MAAVVNWYRYKSAFFKISDLPKLEKRRYQIKTVVSEFSFEWSCLMISFTDSKLRKTIHDSARPKREGFETID